MLLLSGGEIHVLLYDQNPQFAAPRQTPEVILQIHAFSTVFRGHFLSPTPLTTLGPFHVTCSLFRVPCSVSRNSVFCTVVNSDSEDLAITADEARRTDRLPTDVLTTQGIYSAEGLKTSLPRPHAPSPTAAQTDLDSSAYCTPVVPKVDKDVVGDLAAESIHANALVLERGSNGSRRELVRNSYLRSGVLVGVSGPCSAVGGNSGRGEGLGERGGHEGNGGVVKDCSGGVARSGGKEIIAVRTNM